MADSKQLWLRGAVAGEREGLAAGRQTKGAGKRKSGRTVLLHDRQEADDDLRRRPDEDLQRRARDDVSKALEVVEADVLSLVRSSGGKLELVRLALT